MEVVLIQIDENRLFLGSVIEVVYLAHLRREVDNHFDSIQNGKNWNTTIPDLIALSIHMMMKHLTERVTEVETYRKNLLCLEIDRGFLRGLFDRNTTA